MIKKLEDTEERVQNNRRMREEDEKMGGGFGAAETCVLMCFITLMLAAFISFLLLLFLKPITVHVFLNFATLFDYLEFSKKE